MVTGLLDTTILVDLLRQYSPAENWISQQQNLGITTVVWIELIQGVTNRVAQQNTLNVLKSYTKVEVEVIDIEWAIQTMLKFKLSHNVLAFDALIASVSYRLQVPLYTRNLKHFRPILGNLAQSPY
jgi:predicted nucleic acid-binding protein